MQHKQIDRLKLDIAAKGNDLVKKHKLIYQDIEGVSNSVISKIQNYRLEMVGLGQIITYYEIVSHLVGEPISVTLSFSDTPLVAKVEESV